MIILFSLWKINHFLLSEPHGENGYSSIKRDFDDTIPNLGREGNTVPDLISSTQGKTDKSNPKSNKYRINRNFSKDLILALLARLFSSLILCIANNLYIPLRYNVFYEKLIKNRLSGVSLKFDNLYLG